MTRHRRKKGNRSGKQAARRNPSPLSDDVDPRNGAPSTLTDGGTPPGSPKDSAAAGLSSRRRNLRLAVVLVLLALLVRLVYTLESSDGPTFSVPVVDALVYHEAAAQFARGEGLDESYFFQPFLYPFLLSTLYRILGVSIVAAKIVQILLGSLTCLAVFLLGRKIFGPWPGFIAGCITALYGPLIFFEGELLATGLAAFWSVILTFLVLEAAERGGKVAFLLLGLAGGLAVLTRPVFLPFLVIGCLYIAVKNWTRPTWRPRLPVLVLMAFVGFALPTVPVVVVSHQMTGRATILPASGGLNLYLGNNPHLEETINVRPGSQWSDVIDLPRRHGIRGSMWDRQRFYYGRVSDYLFSEPLGFASGLGQKTLQLLSSRETARNVDIYLFRRFSKVLSVLVWKIGPFGFPFGILLPLAAAGILFSLRRTPWWLFTAIGVYALFVVLVFVTARYRVPIVPLLALFASAGITGIVEILTARRWKSLIGTAGLIAAVFLLATLPGPFAPETLDYEPELCCCLAESLQQRNRIDEAMAWFQSAIDLNPNYADAHINLATLYMLKGRSEEAIDACRRALQVRPDLAQAHNTLAILLTEKRLFGEAIEHCRRGLEIRPHEEAFHFNLARVHAEQGDTERTKDHLLHALELNPRLAAAHFELGRLFEREGRIDVALEYYRSASKLQPDVDTLSQFGTLLLRAGQPGEAVECLRQLVGLAPESCEFRHTLAVALGTCGRGREAITEYRRVLALNPGFVPSLAGLAWLLATDSDPAVRDAAEGVSLAEKAVRLAPGNPNVMNTLAAAYAAVKRYDDAVRAALEAIELARRSGLFQLAEEIDQRRRIYMDHTRGMETPRR